MTKNTRTFLGLLVVFLILGVAVFYVLVWRSSSPPVTPTTTSAASESSNSIRGILEADIVYLSSENGGKVSALPFAAGQPVKKGDVVAQLDTALLEAQRDAAQSRLNSAQSLLMLMNNQPRKEDLAVAQEAVNYAQVTVKAAQQVVADAKRYSPSELRDQSVNIAQAQADRASAGLAEAQARLASVQKGADPADLQAAQSAVDKASAELAVTQNQIAHLALKAPEAGFLLDRLVFAGEVALPGWPIVSLIYKDRLNLQVLVPQNALAGIKPGQEVDVSLVVDPSITYRGLIKTISEQPEYTGGTSQQKTALYPVSVQIASIDNLLKPGLQVEVFLGGKK